MERRSAVYLRAARMASEGSDQGPRQRQPRVIVDHPRRGAAVGNREDCRNHVEHEVSVTDAMIYIDRDVALGDVDLQRTARSRSTTDVLQHRGSTVVRHRVGQCVHGRQRRRVMGP
jgi:hypothetical protein